MDRGPGGSPKTFSDPESTFSLPTMHFSKVVFPQPDGPTKKNVLVLNQTLGESFYYINYGSSIIISKKLSKNSALVFPEK